MGRTQLVPLNSTLKYVLAVLLFIVVCLSYSNHFTNGFEFDDSHTIVNNQYIRNVNNIPLFFTDIKYYGTNVGNQGYNPILTTLNAVDYWLADGLDPVYFHTSIFCWYIVQLVLMFFMIRIILNKAVPSETNTMLSLLMVGFYGVHTANAETLNYIIMRSDSFSALCIVAALLLYTVPVGRKYLLYIPVAVIGILTKEIGLMVVPLIFIYELLFEQGQSLADVVLLRKTKGLINTILRTLPVTVICIGLFVYVRIEFMPEDNALFTPSSAPGP